MVIPFKCEFCKQSFRKRETKNKQFEQIRKWKSQLQMKVPFLGRESRETIINGLVSFLN